MNIKFYWNGNIAGHTFHLEIDGEEIDLGLNKFSQNREEAIKKIIKILKTNYNVDYDEKDVKFVWGGRL